MERRRAPDLSAFELRVLAMTAMLADHMYKILGIGGPWMTLLGRLAFPLFAFQLAEGYEKSHDRAAYGRRLWLGALIAEIPFDLAFCGRWLDGSRQNVLFTLGLGLLVLHGLSGWKKRPVQAAAALLLGCAAAQLLRTDYGGGGIMTIAVFYLAGRWPAGGRAFALISLAVIHGWMLAGEGQLLAVAALAAIWMYHGRQGFHSRAWRRFCYWFYPAHLLALAGLSVLLGG